MSEPSVIKGRVIVWDGEAPKVWKLTRRWPFLQRVVADPTGHPQCAKIMEFSDGKPAVTTYQRG